LKFFLHLCGLFTPFFGLQMEQATTLSLSIV
jgi:hypothetical protein